VSQRMSKEEIVKTINKLASKLRRAPTTAEIESMSPVRRRQLRTQFGNYTNALRACGLGKAYTGLSIPMGLLFDDWAMLARKLKKLPTIMEYRELGKHSTGPILRRCLQWSAVPRAMHEYAQERGLERDWADVLGMIQDRLTANGMADPEKWPGLKDGRSRIKKDRPVYGPLMSPRALMHVPTNEAGVMFLFATMAFELGFMATMVRTEFPDCEALREIEPNKLQRVLIEFEYESRNFLKHGHRVEGCDMIVCWINNWPDCPLEVLELSKIVGKKH